MVTGFTETPSVCSALQLPSTQDHELPKSFCCISSCSASTTSRGTMTKEIPSYVIAPLDNMACKHIANAMPS